MMFMPNWICQLNMTTVAKLMLFLNIGHIASSSSWFIHRLPLQALGSRLFCDNIPGLSISQRKLCQQYPDLMAEFGSGLELAVEECQHQFKKHRWNCSSFKNERDTSGFANFLLKGSKEVAFIHAVTSAAVVHSLATACRDGSLHNCACDPSKTRGKSRDSNGEFDWTGCSNNVKFGLKFARLFIDAKESQTRDGRGLMNLHNNNLGRRAVNKHLELKCKCHGVSGSCSVRTCWKSLQEFAMMGDFIKKRYNKAILVEINQDATGLSTMAKSNRAVRKGDMVYMDESPNYCTYSPSQGSVGTAGRLCSTDTQVKEESCEQICCGRGYYTSTVQETISCDCKFQWCCFVECKQCRITKNESICKG